MLLLLLLLLLEVVELVKVVEVVLVLELLAAELLELEELSGGDHGERLLIRLLLLHQLLALARPRRHLDGGRRLLLLLLLLVVQVNQHRQLVENHFGFFVGLLVQCYTSELRIAIATWSCDLVSAPLSFSFCFVVRLRSVRVPRSLAVHANAICGTSASAQSGARSPRWPVLLVQDWRGYGRLRGAARNLRPQLWRLRE